MKITPRSLVQFFTYERQEYPQAVLAAPQLVQSEGSLLGSLAAADRPPTPPELRVPNTGAVIGGMLANLPGNILGAYKEKMQLPLEAQKIQTEMQEQNLAQERLKGINPDSLQYQTTLQGSNVGVPSYPIQFGGSMPVTNVQPQTTTTPAQTPPANQSQPATPATPPAQAAPQNLAQQVPGIVSAGSGAAGAGDVAQTSLPSGKDIFDAYKNHITNRATGWNAEFDQYGQPTNRVVIHHSDGIPAQPVDKKWAAMYLPGLGPKQSNTAMGQEPAPTPDQNIAATAPAALASLQSVASPPGQIDQTDQQQNQQPDLSGKLAAGTLSPSDVIAAGGAPWAGTKAAPQAPLPQQSYVPPVPRAQLVTPIPPGQQPQQSQPPQPSPALQRVPDNAVAESFGGIPPNILGKALQDHQYTVVGPAETSPDGTDAQGNPLKPSTKVSMTIAGNQVPGYVDSEGNLYQVRNRTPYHETRVYANGTQAEIDNAIGQHEDQEMMDTSMKHMTVSGNWQSMSRPAKIAAYKQAQAEEEYPVNQAQTDSLAAKEGVIDASNKLLGAIDKYKTPGDPTALGIRNAWTSGQSDVMSRVGPAVKAATGGSVDMGAGDPRVDELHQAYHELDMALRSQTGAAVAGRLPADVGGTKGVEDLIGSFDSPRLPQLVQSHLQTLGQNMQVQLDHMIANKQRIPATAQYKANMITDGNNAPGGNQFPFPVTNRSEYDKVPVGAKYKVQDGRVVTKLPGY